MSSSSTSSGTSPTTASSPSTPTTPQYVCSSDAHKRSPQTNHPSPTRESRSVIDILRIGFLSGDLAEIPQRIVAAVTAPTSSPVHPELLNILTLLLSQLGVDFTHAQRDSDLDTTPASEPSPESLRTCMRCLEPYQERENGASACVVPHAPPYVNACGISVDKHGRPLETRYYPCCGTTFAASSSSPWDGACYTGPHISSSDMDVDTDRDNKENLGTLDTQMAIKHATIANAFSPTHPGQARSRPGPGSRSDISAPRHDGFNGDAMIVAATARTGIRPSSPSPLTCVSNGFTAPHPQASVFAETGNHHHHHVRATATTADARPHGCPAPGSKVIQTIPWRESSLYHPYGWIDVPSSLRRRWDDPRYV